MTTERLQLALIPDLRPPAQPLPPDVRAKGVELIAAMLVRLVRRDPASTGTTEVRDEPR